MIYTDDLDAYKNVPIDYHWVFNKLMVATMMNQLCGPTEIPVPKEDFYVLRPMMNLFGMGARAMMLKLYPDRMKHRPGHFWTQKFIGPHYSVDYDQDGNILSAYQGIKKQGSPLWKWSLWRKVHQHSSVPSFPQELHKLRNVSSYFNIEWIGGNLIEVHLRRTPEIERTYETLIPAWKGDQQTYLKALGYTFIESVDETATKKRLGFWVI